MAATVNLAARLSMSGVVFRVDVKDRPASDDGRFKASRNVDVIALTDGGGLVQVRIPEQSQLWAERTLATGLHVDWMLDLAEGRGEYGSWSRLEFVAEIAPDGTLGVSAPALADA